MPPVAVMPLKEKLAISLKAIEAQKQGNEDEYMRIMMEEMPMPPYMAKFAKEYLGADFLIKGGWNLTEANAEYGSDWLNK
jgi:hypothetical protein